MYGKQEDMVYIDIYEFPTYEPMFIRNSLKGVPVALISLGCDKNTVDSENMLGGLGLAGCIFTNDLAKAQIIIINTCGFLKSAIKESEDNIRLAIKQKDEGVCRAVIVAGCAAERFKAHFLNKFDEIDAIVGVNEYSEIKKITEDALNRTFDKRTDYTRLDKHRFNEELFLNRIVSTPKHYAYLKIAEGCDKKCTYCTIPNIRGPYRSRTFDSLIQEARMLAKKGVKELILVAQDTTLYGTDLYDKKRLHELLFELSKIKNIVWIRILYCYPEHIYPELLQEIKNNKKVTKYIDMPIQHSENKILKLMGRQTTKEFIKDIINEIRETIPNISIRTTLISGFPGEEREDFKALCNFVKEMKFDKLGVFPYSREEGTPADKLPDHITERTKNTRAGRIMLVQKEVSENKLKEKVGSIITIVTEGNENGMYYGRSEFDAPEIDTLVHFASNNDIKIGDFVQVEIQSSDEYDLKGVAV